ncbi:MAG TPA: ThiF family adenylyltransferase [Frateuria sp.]|uniref:ThiF family adenylyltransferase n=1 Tax=Frateuria sp. TaxID=2211372 RepID=UPI002D7E2BCB|nr:ThiF family adenylyltransferase [Frateuria sp.]HET6804001.1 ThiF family adenylyltransferase [Frateuria sp.]
MCFVEWGELIPGATADQRQEPQLQALLRACGEHPDMEVVELRRVPGDALGLAIVVDVGDGTVAPGNAVGILRRERLALVYRPAAAMPFEVRPLRRDFPETLHQHSVAADEPRSLCLYDQPWSELERSWTAGKFLTRVLQWLERTADGSLHADDQALEQLFYDAGVHLVLPSVFRGVTALPNQPLRLRLAHQGPPHTTLIGSFGSDPGLASPGLPFVPLLCEVPGVAHPPIQSPPRSLGELQARLEQAGSSLFPALTDAIRQASKGGLTPARDSANAHVLLLVRVPRLRAGDVERVDVVGFLLQGDIAGLGLCLGVLHQVQPGGAAFAFTTMQSEPQAPGATVEAWRSLALDPIHIRYRVDNRTARLLSGLASLDEGPRGVLAGLGALGSALAELWAREGWGRWDLVDPDIVEPHNVVRHLARDPHIGLPKVAVVKALTQDILGEPCDTEAIQASANAQDHAALQRALAGADLLVDATTTLDVPRDWSATDMPRTASVFLTPSGRGSVLLLEDRFRAIRMAALEAQYYRAVLREPWGAVHLRPQGAVRVGAGCRDRSFVISAAQIVLHAALLDQAIQRSVANDAASIHAWTVDPNTGAVAFHQAPVFEVCQQTRSGWTIYWDLGLESDLASMRNGALPSETGGILLGVVDHKLHTIHLVEACPAPSDSQATPHDFIRGTQGVVETRQACLDRTQGQVDYVGEWHSHPPGVGATPSPTDAELLGQLACALVADGVPSVMVIAGAHGEVSVSLGQVL